MTTSPRHMHLANARLSQTTSASTAADITKLVRLYYDPPKAPPYKYEKVCQKTSQTMLHERPESTWENHYTRRAHNMQCGYYSIPNEPYKNVGGMFDLDPYDLVINTISKNLNPKIREARNKEAKKVATFNPPKKRRMSYLPQLGPKQSTNEEDGQEEEKSDGGRSAIKCQLNELRKAKNMVKTGQSFENFVVQMQEEKESSRNKPKYEKDEMVLIPITSPCLLQTPVESSKASLARVDIEPTPTCDNGSPPDLAAMGSRSDVSCKDLPEDEDNRLMLQMSPDKRKKSVYLRSATSLFAVIDLQAAANERKERLKRIHIEFLEALRIVINSLYNMKGRDIKSKVPLTVEYLKQLRKDTHVPVPGDIRFPSRQARPMRNPSVLTVPSSIDTSKPQSSININPFSKKKPNMFEQLAMLPSKLSKTKNLGMNIFKRKQQEENELKLESWEDFLAVNPVASIPKRQPRKSFATGVQILVKAVQWQRRISMAANLAGNQDSRSPMNGIATPSPENNEGGVPKIENLAKVLHSEQGKKVSVKKTPIWQKIAQEKVEVYEETKRSKNETIDPEDIVDNMQSKFVRLKQKHKQETDAEVQKLERERVQIIRYKYGLFDQMGWCYDEYQLKLRNARNNIHMNVDIGEVKPSIWFEELRDTAFKVCGRGREVTDLVNKLAHHSTMDSKSIHLGKAKLCLLVMSFPGNEICTVAFQTAIKFVLETIMLQDLKNLTDWLELRKVPYNVYDKKES